MIRSLVDRFHAHVLNLDWAQAQRQLSHLFKDLERILAVLHHRIEYPAATLSDRVSCTVNTAINSTTFADITGATVTLAPDVNSKLLVTASWDVTCTALGGAFGDLFSGALAVNGALETPRAAWTPHVANERDVVSQTFVVALTAGVAYTVKLQARTTNAPTTFSVASTHTGFSALLVPDPYQMPGQ
jgi:hypothetical protein